jgi:hypothetical protein
LLVKAELTLAVRLEQLVILLVARLFLEEADALMASVGLSVGRAAVLAAALLLLMLAQVLVLESAAAVLAAIPVMAAKVVGLLMVVMGALEAAVVAAVAQETYPVFRLFLMVMLAPVVALAFMGKDLVALVALIQMERVAAVVVLVGFLEAVGASV